MTSVDSDHAWKGNRGSNSGADLIFHGHVHNSALNTLRMAGINCQLDHQRLPDQAQLGAAVAGSVGAAYQAELRAADTSLLVATLRFTQQQSNAIGKYNQAQAASPVFWEQALWLLHLIIGQTAQGHDLPARVSSAAQELGEVRDHVKSQGGQNSLMHVALSTWLSAIPDMVVLVPTPWKPSERQSALMRFGMIVPDRKSVV